MIALDAKNSIEAWKKRRVEITKVLQNDETFWKAIKLKLE